MTKPRSHYVDPHHARYYHITSRCVRRAFLLGSDPITGKDYNHRKAVFLQRLKHLSHFFSVNIMAYAIMSNHFHIVVYFDPNGTKHLSDEDIAFRWCALFNQQPIDTPPSIPQSLSDFELNQTIRYHELLIDPQRIQQCRNALASLSTFMQHLKQPFALWANRQDDCKGHFFESRFYSGALLDEVDLMACMAYVDLNPVEANIARSLREAGHTAVHERLYADRFDADRLTAYLAPLWEDEAPGEAQQAGGANDDTDPQYRPVLPYRLLDYARQLNLAIVYLTGQQADLPDGLAPWMVRLLNRERHKRQAAPFFDYAY